MYNKKEIGYIGEQIAERFLQTKKYNILSLNWRTRYGELDIIALDNENLVFAEVKTRQTMNAGHPEESINKRKLGVIRNTAKSWLVENSKYDNRPIRIDAISVFLNYDAKKHKYVASVKHIVGVE
jgi:putative endonuclease